jgi:lysophospholipase L1-like esterase
MTFNLQQAQEDSVAVVDTLTESYSNQWDATSGLEQASPMIKAAASNDLIFIVLGVSLIIWFVLLFFIIRVDKKVGRLEKEITQTNTTDAS